MNSADTRILHCLRSKTKCDALSYREGTHTFETFASPLVTVNDIEISIACNCYSTANHAAVAALVPQGRHIVFNSTTRPGIRENCLLPIELNDGTVEPRDISSKRRGIYFHYGDQPKLLCTMQCTTYF